LARNQAKLSFQDATYADFMDALKSPFTKEGYGSSFRRYLEYHKLKSADDLLIHAANPRYIESQIIDYVKHLKKNDVAYASIEFYVAPVFTFYQLNDVVLNRKKISRHYGEYRRVAKDEAYTTEQIQQMLQNADQRMRMIILLLSSTAARIGSLPALTLGNLTKLPDYGLYKIVFYDGTSSEYYNFCTRECASTGIDNYLNFRKRCGENLAFNENTNRWEPDDTPLIRLQFDINDVLQIRHPRPITLNAIRVILNSHLVKSGIRTVEHPTADSPNCRRVRKNVALSNGFRKHVISTFIQAGLNHEIRELIVDHATHLDANYFRPSEDQVLEEYLKAEPYLTLDPSVRLSQENQILKIRADKVDEAFSKIDDLKEKLGIV
jgi:integrase